MFLFSKSNIWSMLEFAFMFLLWITLLLYGFCWFLCLVIYL